MASDKDSPSSSSREKDVALGKAFSVIDFETLNHDDCVEEFLWNTVNMDPILATEARDVPISALAEESGDPRDPDTTTTISVPPLEYVVPEFRNATNVPEPIRALHAMTAQI